MTMTARRWVLLAAALTGALLTARLGWWQLDRADQKLHLQQALQSQRALPPLRTAELAQDGSTAAAQVHRATVLQGTWLPQHTVYLDNRQMNGRPGFFVVTPLRLDDASAVLVQRGWLPRDAQDRTRVSVAAPMQGPVQVHGRLAPAPSRLYEFSAAASGPIRQNLALDAFAQETGLRLRPFTLVQEDDAAAPAQDGLLRQWLQPAADVHKHYGYAVQWFAMSALIIGLYAWFQLIRPSRHATEPQA